MYHVSVRDFKPNYETNLLAHIVQIIVITIVFFASIVLVIVKLRGLFVAHRKEILSQSLACSRGILKDLNFGSMMVGGLKPDSFEHLFVSLQSEDLVGSNGNPGESGWTKYLFLFRR